MPLNPALRQETIESPIHRGNPLNDPKYQEIQGYNTYDLNNTQLMTPRFGEVTPSEVFETTPGDRHFVKDNTLQILNQIDANLVTTVNSYIDTFFVPMRSMYPINVDKIVPNPTKGDDVPDKALPMIPLLWTLRQFAFNAQDVDIRDGSDSVTFYNGDAYYGDPTSSLNVDQQHFRLNLCIYLAYILSKGQLLDYLGCSFDLAITDEYLNSYRKQTLYLQTVIDKFWDALQSSATAFLLNDALPEVLSYDLSEYNDQGLTGMAVPVRGTEIAKLQYLPTADEFSLSGFRAAIYDSIEKGLYITIDLANASDYSIFAEESGNLSSAMDELLDALKMLTDEYLDIFEEGAADPFDLGYINPSRIVAYQQSVAEYMSNDSVDNIYTAELWMQNMRSIMFPSVDGVTQEPTFVYNGVDTEYDLFTTGAFERAFGGAIDGIVNRMLPFLSNLLVMRRSLTYGDYFATGRPQMLAVGQVGIPVRNGQVNALEAVNEMLMARFLNASNWVGPKYKSYVGAMYNVTPSDTGCHPSFIAHRKIVMNGTPVNNTTSADQGKQVTNLQGTSDGNGFDVFIDDFGVIVSVVSYDALPSYTSGIDAAFRMSDRFSLFNPMLQNIGDQAILPDELTGTVDLFAQKTPFAYTVRYAQYKFGVNKAHGAFAQDLPGYAFTRNWRHQLDSDSELHINPDYIRDKPFYFDQFKKSATSLSPSRYFHFIASVHNLHVAGRKMQYQPPVLF